jgi:GNAT superfamily N-acetyltransferase
MTDITIEPLNKSEIPQSCELVERVFREHVAPLYPDDGVIEFMKFCTTDEMAKRIEDGAITMAARSAGRLVGLIHIIDLSHIAWFFVDTALQGKGIGRNLFNAVLEQLQEQRPDLENLTVNSSPNSIGVYERLGFKPSGPETTVNGIRFRPMAYPVSF